MNSSERMLAATVFRVRARSASAFLETASRAMPTEVAWSATALSLVRSSEGEGSLTKPVEGRSQFTAAMVCSLWWVRRRNRHQPGHSGP
jgi:hypothetical protein